MNASFARSGFASRPTISGAGWPPSVDGWKGATTRLQSGITRRRERAQGRLAASVGRLESLSPLAVLGRGYAVCWNEDRTAIVRAADSVSAGDRVHVTLDAGELQCEVLTTRAERGQRA